MKYKSVVLFLIITVYLVTLLSGCDKSFENPGDYLGGGGTILTEPVSCETERPPLAICARMRIGTFRALILPLSTVVGSARISRRERSPTRMS